MGNAKLDPRSLTSEERALWDRAASKQRYIKVGSRPPWHDCYELAWPEIERMILARRAIFGEPASEPAKVECKHSMDTYTGACAFCGIEEPVQPEPVKVECPNCRELGDHMIPATAGHFLGPQYLCQFMPKPAQPKPVAHEDAEFMRAGALAMARIIERDEKPEPVAAVKLVAYEAPKTGETLYRREPVAAEMEPPFCLDCGRSVYDFHCGGPRHSAVASLHPSEPVTTAVPEGALSLATASLRHAGLQALSDAADEIDRWLARLVDTHAAQPAKVRMTEELERVLATAVHGAAAYMNAKMYGHAEEARLAIAAVRAQAAEAGKVRMPKVRIALNTMKTHFEPNCQGQCEFPMVWNICRFGIEELDAHEKGEGRG